METGDLSDSVKKKKERECTSEKRILSYIYLLAYYKCPGHLLAIPASATAISFQPDQGLCSASDGNAESAVSSDPGFRHRLLVAGNLLSRGNDCGDWRMSALWWSSVFVRMSGDDGLFSLLPGGSQLSAFEF